MSSSQMEINITNLVELLAENQKNTSEPGWLDNEIRVRP
jgi:hypothetical protein